MTDFSSGFIFNLFLFLILPFICGYIAVKLRLPVIMGYIAGGIFLGIFLRDNSHFLEQFAEIGIILLLFAVGLELDFKQIIRYRRFILTGGVAQIIVSSLAIFLLALLFRFNLTVSVIIGLAFTFSSTAVVAKLIQERGEEHSLLGSLIIGILLFQDVVALPLLIIFSSLTPGVGFWLIVKNVVVSLIKACVVFIFVYFAARRLVPMIFEKLAKTSRELLNLLTIVFIIISVLVFSLLRLPSTAAAFLSGVLIAQTMEHYHIFSQIRPLRDLFAILFFVFLGFQMHLSTVIFQMPLILLFTILLLTIKFIIVFVIFLRLRFHSRTAFAAGLMLSQVGEFAFIILHQNFDNKWILYNSYTVALTIVLLTIAVTPILYDSRDKLYLKLSRFIKKHNSSLFNFLTLRDREPAHMHALEISNHVIVCGMGRVGRYIGRALTLVGIPYVAIDYNYHTVDSVRKQGITMIYGDPTDIDVLDYAQTERAAALISTLPDKFSQETVILHAKRLNSRIKIFARVHEEGHQRRMKDLGAHIVVQPEFEAALAIIRKVLVNFNVPQDQIIGKIKRLKLEHGMS